MADIPQVIATYDALVGVALGAGLTYWFGALNRRHQEAREDRTRWYDARFDAYADLSRSYASLYVRLGDSDSDSDSDSSVAAIKEFSQKVGPIMLVGSPRAKNSALLLQRVLYERPNQNDQQLAEAWSVFETAARNDLGHPSP